MRTAKEHTAGAKIVSRDQKKILRRAFSAGDAVTMVLLAATPLWALMPNAALKLLSAGLSRLLPVNWRQDANVADIEKLGGFSPYDAQRMLRRQLEYRLLSLAMVFKDLVWKRGYHIEVEGANHIEAALAEGRGAVIWIADFVCGSDAARQGLYRIGHPSAHMSRPEHGFSHTSFGVKHLNPIRIRAEVRYVEERIVFDRDRPALALNRMSAHLRKNGLVSLLACADEGRSLAEADLFNGKLKLATGAPRLAFTAKCPILPVFTVPAPEPPHFVVKIGPPLAMNAFSKELAILDAVKDFVERLKPYIEAYPHLWRGWPSLVVRDDAAIALRRLEASEHVNVTAEAVQSEP